MTGRRSVAGLAAWLPLLSTFGRFAPAAAQVRPNGPAPARPPRFLGLISGGVDGTYIRIAADIAAVLSEPPLLRIVPMVGQGSVQNIDDLLHLPGVDLAIVQSDVLAFLRSRGSMPGVERNVGYIAKLYDEELHVLAGPGIGGLSDLKGQTVNVDVRGSGTALTASIVFGALGIPVTLANDDNATALLKLRRGEIQALAYVAGKPARLFSSLEPGSGLHLVELPLKPVLLENYVPSRLGHLDYPSLVSPGADVNTVAVGAVLAAFLWPPATEGRRRIDTFLAAFTGKFARFKEPQRHPKWQDVSLAAEVPGWIRVQPPGRGTAPTLPFSQ